MIKSFVAVVGLFAVIYGYTQNVDYFTNTFNIKPLFFRALTVGAVIGFFISRFYNKKGVDGIEKFQISAICMLACMGIFPLLAVWSNHFLSDKTVTNEPVIFKSEMPIRGSRIGIIKGKMPEIEGFYTYFTQESVENRIRSKQSLFHNIAVGTPVELPMRTGFWGYKFVEIR